MLYRRGPTTLFFFRTGSTRRGWALWDGFIGTHGAPRFAFGALPDYAAFQCPVVLCPADECDECDEWEAPLIRNPAVDDEQISERKAIEGELEEARAEVCG